MVEQGGALHEQHQGPGPEEGHLRLQERPEPSLKPCWGVSECADTFPPLLKYFLTSTERRVKRQFYS